MILITIAIPVFNGENTIKKSLENLNSIDYNKFKIEVIVSDNNSSDRTGEIVQKFPKIKYHKNDTNYLYIARIKISKGLIMA